MCVCTLASTDRWACFHWQYSCQWLVQHHTASHSLAEAPLSHLQAPAYQSRPGQTLQQNTYRHVRTCILIHNITNNCHFHLIGMFFGKNSLPDLVTSAPFVAVFRSRLKTHLFNISYPSPLWLYSACTVAFSCFGHYNRSCLVLTYLL